MKNRKKKGIPPGKTDATPGNGADPTTNGQKDTWLDKQEIFERLHLSKRTLQNWRSKGILPYSKTAGKIFYKEADLAALLNGNMQSGNG